MNLRSFERRRGKNRKGHLKKLLMPARIKVKAKAVPLKESGGR